MTSGKEVLQVWGEYFKTLLDQKEERDLDLPSAVGEELKVQEIRFNEVEREMKKVKKVRAAGVGEVRVEILAMDA